MFSFSIIWNHYYFLYMPALVAAFGCWLFFLYLKHGVRRPNAFKLWLKKELSTKPNISYNIFTISLFLLELVKNASGSSSLSSYLRSTHDERFEPLFFFSPLCIECSYIIIYLSMSIIPA